MSSTLNAVRNGDDNPQLPDLLTFWRHKETVYAAKLGGQGRLLTHPPLRPLLTPTVSPLEKSPVPEAPTNCDDGSLIRCDIATDEISGNQVGLGHEPARLTCYADHVYRGSPEKQPQPSEEASSYSPLSIEGTIFSWAVDSDDGLTEEEEVDLEHLDITDMSAMEGSGAELGEVLEGGRGESKGEEELVYDHKCQLSPQGKGKEPLPPLDLGGARSPLQKVKQWLAGVLAKGLGRSEAVRVDKQVDVTALMEKNWFYGSGR